MSKPKNAILHESPEFDEFWTIWKPIRRRTDGRLDAMDGFNKMLNKMLKDGLYPARDMVVRDIIDGARWFVRNTPPNDEFVPLAKSWINDGVWMDDCEKERQFQARQSEPEKVVSLRPAMPKSRFLRQYEGQE